MTDRLYADSSALVKLVIYEPETASLRRLIATEDELSTSRLGVVEVHRAAMLAHASPESERRAELLLEGCKLVALSADVIDRARTLASSRLRTLDAIHLATALRIEAKRIITYDRRLIEAASEAGLRVLHPGLDR